MTGKPPHAFTQRGIGRTFQNIRLFQNMTALENVLVGMHVRLKGDLIEAIVRTPRVQQRGAGGARRAGELLEFSGLRRKDGEFGRNLLVRRPAPARSGPRARHAPAARCCSTSRPPG